jgi:hypothetical protein
VESDNWKFDTEADLKTLQHSKTYGGGADAAAGKRYAGKLAVQAVSASDIPMAAFLDRLTLSGPDFLVKKIRLLRFRTAPG